MGHFVFKLPDIGEGIAESEIAQWHVAVGDTVSEDQPLVDMLTDKAAVELPSPVSGRVLALHGQVGDRIAVGALLVTLAVEGEPAEVASAAGTGIATAQITLAAPVAAGGVEALATLRGAATVAASPATRKRARELGVDIAEVAASGPSGRVLREDVERHAVPASALHALEKSGATAQLAAEDEGVDQVRIIGLRRKIAEGMQRAAQRIPHFAYIEEIDVTELESLRRKLNERYPDRARLTLLPLLIQALIRTVPAFPQINATFDDEAGIVTRHRALHVGIATQMPSGLVVPVVRHAQRLDLWGRAGEIKRLADIARAGKATRQQLSGSTITITSLGALGGLATTPVINAPEVAIIGVNKMVERPVVRAGQVVVRTMMNLSSSFDHRIVDGVDAAEFIQRIKALLETPALLFVD